MAPKDVEEQVRKAETARLKALASAMKALMGTPGWDAYRGELEQAELRLTERMIIGDRDEFDRWKGQIQGLRLAFALPQQIIDRADAL